MGEMSDIARLVDSGEIDAAVEAAAGLVPDRVADLLFASGGYSNDMAPYDSFFRRWYRTLEHPYLRAAAAARFSEAYLTELAGVPGGEAFGAALVEDAIRATIAHTAAIMRGPEISEWAEPYVGVMTRARARAWHDAGRELERIRLPD